MTVVVVRAVVVTGSVVVVVIAMIVEVASHITKLAGDVVELELDVVDFHSIGVVDDVSRGTSSNEIGRVGGVVGEGLSVSFCHGKEVVEWEGAVCHGDFNHLAEERGEAMEEGGAEHVLHGRVLGDGIVTGEEEVVLTGKGDVVGSVIVGEFAFHAHRHDEGNEMILKVGGTVLLFEELCKCRKGERIDVLGRLQAPPCDDFRTGESKSGVNLVSGGNVGALEEQLHAIDEFHDGKAIADVGKGFGVGVTKVRGRGGVGHGEG